MKSKEVYFIVEKSKYNVTINAHLKGSHLNVGYLVYEYYLDNFIEDELDEDFGIEDQVVVIKFLEIFDNYKFKGYGSKLMEEFITHFEKQNMVDKAVLEARPFNSDFGLPKDILMMFYQKFGFEETEFSTNNTTIMEKFKD